jgi:hypothetical protein
VIDEDSKQQDVVMLRSVFVERPATVFFGYPDYCGVTRNGCERTFIATAEDLGKKQLFFKIPTTTNVYNSVVNSMKHAGFRPTLSNNYNMYWGGGKSPDLLRELDY